MLHDKEIKAVIGSYFTLQMVQYMMSIFSSGLAYNRNKVIPEVERNKNTSAGSSKSLQSNNHSEIFFVLVSV